MSGLGLFGFTDNLILLVSDQVSVGQFHFSRSMMAVGLVFLLARLLGASVRPKRWGAVVLRTVFVALSMMLYFSVLPMMPIAEAAAGLFTSPILVLVFSTVLFRERIGWRRVLAVAIGSIGVLLVLKPGGDGFSLYHLLPLMAAACYAMGAIVTYRYCRDESALGLTLAFLVAVGIGGVISTSLMTVFPVSPALLAEAPFLFRGGAAVDTYFWGVMVLIAVSVVGGMWAVNRAYQLTLTSYAAVYEYTYLITAGFTGWLFWGTAPDRYSLLGIIFIIAAGVMITIAQQRQD
ncbi:MAG: DMT family transporter [Candidatus Puniceispirillales bacterium]